MYSPIFSHDVSHDVPRGVKPATNVSGLVAALLEQRGRLGVPSSATLEAGSRKMRKPELFTE